MTFGAQTCAEFGLLKLLWFVLLLICFPHLSPWTVLASTTPEANSTSWQLSLVPKDYNKEDVPTVEGKAVVVNCSFLIWAVSSISVANMDYEVDLYLWIEWKDPRLQIPLDKINATEDLHTDIAKKIWVPPLMFRNCKNCEVITFDPIQHKITMTNGIVGFYMRHTKKFACAFDLTFYPFDKQKCRVEVESFVDRIERLKMIHDETTYKIQGDVQLPELVITKIYNTPCVQADEVIIFACISIGFSFERLISYHVMQTFAPSILIVVISWLSFWIDVSAAPARVALGVSTLLTLVTQFMNAQKSLPATSYMKALDIWMFTCLFTVFASLVEFTIANVYQRTHAKKATNTETGQRPVEAQKQPRKNRVDQVSKILFPAVFTFFTLLYWSIFPNVS